jgi:hypothetical protein
MTSKSASVFSKIKIKGVTEFMIITGQKFCGLLISLVELFLSLPVVFSGTFLNPKRSELTPP